MASAIKRALLRWRTHEKAVLDASEDGGPSEKDLLTSRRFPNPAEAVEREDTREFLLGLVCQLPLQPRCLIILRFYGGLTLDAAGR